jgi:hypothetical protein
MIPDVGSTALFTFKAKFDTLNGVYRIRAETTFRDAVAAGVDFVANLYNPAGLNTNDFNADFPSYTSDKVVMLESVKDSSVVYQVPESAFLNVPDPTIQEYFPLIAVINLGVHQNTQAIFPLLDQIKDIVQASLGVTDPLNIVTNPDNKVYLTDADYEQLKLVREANIRKLKPLSVQLAEANRDIVLLQTKLALYEKRIITQAGG